MSTRAQTELCTKDILKNLKKRETDKRHRLNKKRTFDETVEKLAMAIAENEKLKSFAEDLLKEISRLERSAEDLLKEIKLLTSQKERIEQRLDTIYNELVKEIECVRAKADGFGEQGA